MLTAFDATEVDEFTFPNDTEPKTIFKIGVLDTVLRAHLNDMLTRYELSSPNGDDPAGVNINLEGMRLQAVRFGLKGWDNFKDKHGNEIKFDTVSVAVKGVGNRDGLSPRALAAIRHEWIEPLGNAILNGNKFNKEEIKN
jgi:hypothetical protein